MLDPYYGIHPGCMQRLKMSSFNLRCIYFFQK